METEGPLSRPGSGVEGETRAQPLLWARAGLVAGRCQPEGQHGRGPGTRTKAWAADGSHHEERTDDSVVYVWSRPGEAHERRGHTRRAGRARLTALVT